MLNYAIDGPDASPCQPRADQDHIAPPISGSFIHVDYLRQRMSRVFPTASGSIVAPETLESVFPPHIIEQLQEVDWPTSDLPIAFGLASRLGWIWTLRFHQLEKRLHVSGDAYLYDQVFSALLDQIQSRPLSASPRDSAFPPLPRRLPEANTIEFHSPWAQRGLRQSLEAMLAQIANAAWTSGIDHRPSYIEAVLYQYDSRFYEYLRQVRDVVATHGRWNGTGIREYEGSSGEGDDGSKGGSLLRFRRKKAPQGSLGLAIFGAKRILMLWQTFEDTIESSQPSERAQAVYHLERGTLQSVLASNSRYQGLTFRMSLLVPTFLQHPSGSRSLGDVPGTPHDRIRLFLRDLGRAALECDEPAHIDRKIVNLSDWYSERQLEDYSHVLLLIGKGPSGSPSGAPKPVAQPSDHAPAIPDGDDPSVDSLPATAEVTPAPDEPPMEPAAASINRGGRPRIAIPYHLLARIHNDLLKARIKEGGDRISPISYRLIRDRYWIETGRTISEETIASRVKQWRAAGLTWPPPFTGDEDDEGEGVN